MEIYELPITTEESRNYHKFLFQLKALNLNGWVRAYITSVIYTVIMCFIIFTFSQEFALILLVKTTWYVKALTFIVIFLFAALQRSKNQQLKAMLQKYFMNNLPQEFLDGGIILKKIKVQGDRIVVYYRKRNGEQYCMLVAGAKCDKCGRLDEIPYTSETAVQVMLRQKGWKFTGSKCICPICSIKEKNQTGK